MSTTESRDPPPSIATAQGGTRISLGVRLARRARAAAVRRGLAPADRGPVGTVRSLREWALEHPDGGARWISSPVPAEPPLSPPRSVEGQDASAFAAAMVRYETYTRLPAEAKEVAVLPGGRIVRDDGFVITEDGLLAVESAWDAPHLDASGVLAERRMPPARMLAGAHASLISKWCGAYYHWIADALPRLAVLEAAGCADAALIVPEALSEWQRRSLQLLGVDNELTPFSGYLRAETLIWPRPVAIPSHLPAWACRWLHERLVGAAPSASRRLYLTRRENARSVVNEDEVWRLLSARGFELVDPGKLPLDEQIALFAEAAWVVAPHGGALTNLVFASGATVIELFEPGYVVPCYYELAARAGHSYWYLIGTAAGDGGIGVDVQALARTLADAGLET